MPVRILFVAATSVEADILGKIPGLNSFSHGYRYGNAEISVLVTGVGSVPTVWEVQNWLCSDFKPDIAVNIGIAGSYRENIPIGEVVAPVKDCFADSGIEDNDHYLTLFEAGLAGKDLFPYTGGVIIATQDITDRFEKDLKQVNAITVNMATGSDKTRERLTQKFNPDIETMEGAAFFYACTRLGVPFIALRAVSNLVGKRDKTSWNIGLALQNLTTKLEEILPEIIAI